MTLSSKKYLFYFLSLVLTIVAVWLVIKDKNADLKTSIPDSSNVLIYKTIDSLVSIDIPKAEKLLKETPKSKTSNNRDLAYYFTYKIAVDIEKNHFDSIPLFADKALTYSRKLEDSTLQAKLNNNLGKYYRHIGDYTKSLNYTLKGLTFAKDHSVSQIELYNNLGGIYFELNDFDLAKEYLEKAQVTALAIKDKKRTAIANANIGNVYLMISSYDKAKKNLNNSLQYFEQIKDTVKIIKCLTSISKIELLQNNFNSAIQYLDQASSLSHSTKEQVQLGLIFQHYGNAYKAAKELERSNEYYRKALEIANTNKIARDKMNALEGLATNYNSSQKYKEANENLIPYYQIKDSIQGIKVRQQIEELKWAVILDKEKFKNQLLYKKIETEKLNKSNLTKTYIILITVILSIVVFVWMLYQNNKKSLRISNLTNESLSDKIAVNNRLKLIQEEQFQQEREAQNKELISLNILILAKNKIFNEIESTIDKGEDDLKTLFTELKKVIKSNQNQERDWEKFRGVFEKTHPNFFDTIKNDFPQLSKTEIRVCTYIKINMTNTEICEMLNINQMSLNKSRYRIRKKLDLLGTEDLDDFVRSW